MEEEKNNNNENNDTGFSNNPLRQIKVSSARKTIIDKSMHKSEKGVSYKAKNKRWLPKIAILAVLLLLIFVFVSIFFHKANIVITPKIVNNQFANEFYEIHPVTLNNTNDKVQGSQQQKISGKIKIINDTSTEISLISKTRFATADGLIFRIPSRVTIPANGSILAIVVASENKEEYKIKKDTKMWIPAFKEKKSNERYRNIYAIVNEDFSDGKKVLLTQDVNVNIPQMRYLVMPIKVEDDKKIKSIGVEQIQKKAVGKIKIINNTTKAQPLIKKTRFQVGDLVFRIVNSTNVLAKSSVIVDAVADEAGEKYNIKAGQKMLIPGLEKYKDKYQNIYGETAIDFIGGKIGKENVPNKEELEKAKKELTEQAKADLDVKMREAVLNKYLLIKGIYKDDIVFDTLSLDGDKVDVVAKASRMIAVISREEFIEKALLTQDVTLEDLKNYDINGIHKLDVKVVDEQNFDISKGDKIKISITGDVNLIQKVDKDLFKKILKGKERKEYIKLIKDSFPGIKTKISISPFWRTSIPDSLEKINININKNK